VLVANYRDIAFAYAELKLFKQTHA
jgi:hypothetical protein